MLQTSARLLRVLALLQSRRFWSGDALADELDVTQRSVRRDIDRLRTLGYPVHATAGVGGGYQLGAGKDLPPLPLDDDEAVAVAVGLRAAMTGPIKGLEEASVRALAKLEQVLPQRLRRRANALQAVSVQLSEPGATIDARTLSVIASACRDSDLVHFAYSARAGERTERTVEPYRLVHTSRRWYLLAFDLTKQAWRTFRMDRLSAPRPGQPFKPRRLPAEDVAAYVSQAVSTNVYPLHARVTVLAPKEAVTQRLSGLGGRIVAHRKDRCEVQLGGQNVETLAYYLASLGFEFQVHEPQALIDHLRVLSQRLGRASRRSAK